MKKSSIIVLSLLLVFFAKQTTCVKVILLNRTGRDIRIKTRALGVSDSDATRINITSNDACIIPDADIQYTIAWAYRSMGNLQKIRRGSQYNGRDIALPSNHPHLIIITGHGRSQKYKSNYLEMLLTEDEAIKYTEAIIRIDNIKDSLEQICLTYTQVYKESLSFGEWAIDKAFGTEKAPFNFFLEQSFTQDAEKSIQELLDQLDRWSLEIQEANILLEQPSNKCRIYCYGQKTLGKIKSMMERIALFFEQKDDTISSNTRVIHKPRVEILHSEDEEEICTSPKSPTNETSNEEKHIATRETIREILKKESQLQ